MKLCCVEVALWNVLRFVVTYVYGSSWFCVVVPEVRVLCVVVVGDECVVVA